MLSSFGWCSAAWQPSGQRTSPSPVRYIPNVDFSHPRNIIPVIVIRSHLTHRLFRLILCTFSTQFLLFSLSHFHFPVTFPGLDPVVQPLVGKQKTRAPGDWTIIFLCSVLLWLWAGGVQLTMACTQMHWAGAALKPFKGCRSCRREKLEIWNRATWLPAEHKWTLDSVIILTRALKNNCYP